MFAIFVTGGKQYKVSEGDVVFVEKLGVEEGEKVTFDKVLCVSGESLTVGTPYVAGATVVANVVKNGKSKKIDVINYKLNCFTNTLRLSHINKERNNIL